MYASFFSDLAVFYAPFESKDELLTLFRIAGMLYTCTSVSIVRFKAGNYFRGGIEIGLGTELSNGDLYGPVLSETYQLEKDAADYPRIIIGEKLSNFIQCNEQVVDYGTYLNSVLARVDDFCKKMIYQDEDKKFVVDYLGKGIADLSRSSRKLTYDSINKGIAKIKDELNIHKKDDKLNKRLEKLLIYYESRIKFWDD